MLRNLLPLEQKQAIKRKCIVPEHKSRRRPPPSPRTRTFIHTYTHIYAHIQTHTHKYTKTRIVSIVAHRTWLPFAAAGINDLSMNKRSTNRGASSAAALMRKDERRGKERTVHGPPPARHVAPPPTGRRGKGRGGVLICYLP